MKTTRFAILMVPAMLLLGQAPGPETEQDVQLAYWKAAAQATAVQAALRDSMTDSQKRMEQQRDTFGAQAEAARKKMAAFCEAKKQTLETSTFECKPVKEATPQK